MRIRLQSAILIFADCLCHFTRLNKNLTLKNENNLFIFFAQSIFCTIFE